MLLEREVELEYRPQMLEALQRKINMVAEEARATPPQCPQCGRPMSYHDARPVSWLAHWGRLPVIEEGHFREVKTGVLLLPSERGETSPGRRTVPWCDDFWSPARGTPTRSSGACTRNCGNWVG